MTVVETLRLCLNLALNPLKLFFDKSHRHYVTENFKCTMIDCSFEISIPTRITNKKRCLKTKLLQFFSFKLDEFE